MILTVNRLTLLLFTLNIAGIHFSEIKIAYYSHKRKPTQGITVMTLN